LVPCITVQQCKQY